MTPTRPKCPTHPSSYVVDARVPSSQQRHWTCMECGNNLGEAPYREPERESYVLNASDISDIEPGEFVTKTDIEALGLLQDQLRKGDELLDRVQAELDDSSGE